MTFLFIMLANRPLPAYFSHTDAYKYKVCLTSQILFSAWTLGSAKPLNSTEYLPTEVFDLPYPIKLTLNFTQAGPSFVYIFNPLKVVSVHHYQNNCVPYLAGFSLLLEKVISVI